jgi:1-deoxy-D-xylulose-5-phosphate reductoisomerase
VTHQPQRLVILGSTGSIGRQTLEVVAARPDQFTVVGLAARGGNLDLLNEQIRQFAPAVVALDEAIQPDAIAQPRDQILRGAEGLLALATLPEANLIVIATSGHAAIRPTLAAIAAGKEIALANKETIVCAGEIVTAAARAQGTVIRPIDSEHSALWQVLLSARGAASVQRLLITGSGGPFRTMSLDELARVTPAQALKHPTWPNMGGKITIDSASLMNKGLEIIEAHWLFDVPFDRIAVLIHPQSIVHGLIEWNDGAIVAQLGLPDMRLPIAYALTYPDRADSPFPRLDLTAAPGLTFAEPDLRRFPCLRIAYEAGRAGGLYPTILSAADEEAVAAFLHGTIAFTQIPTLLEAALAAYGESAPVTPESIEATDRWARAHVQTRIAANPRQP